MTAHLFIQQLEELSEKSAKHDVLEQLETDKWVDSFRAFLEMRELLLNNRQPIIDLVKAAEKATININDEGSLSITIADLLDIKSALASFKVNP